MQFPSFRDGAAVKRAATSRAFRHVWPRPERPSDPFTLVTAPASRPLRSPLLTPKARDVLSDRLIRVDSAIPGRQYRCPYQNCNEPLRLRMGPNRRRHFAHQRGTDCINPATLHTRAIRWVSEERGILIEASELLEGGTIAREFFCGTVRTEAAFAAAWRGNRRERRIDSLIECDDRVPAIEFVRTHALDAEKRADYRIFASEIQEAGKRLLLMEVQLDPSKSAFYEWSPSRWRNYVLFEAHRRCLPVQPQSGPRCGIPRIDGPKAEDCPI
jgi:hypothetical protein